MMFYQYKKNDLASFFAATFLLAITIFFCPPKAEAHRYHTSLTRIDKNDKEKILEITTQVFLHDLIPALEKKYGKRVDFENSGTDKLIEEYLRENFILKNKKSETKQIEWIGKELKSDAVWVYFQTAWDEDLEGANLQISLFFELFAEQKNLVVARYNEKKADLIFKVGDKFKEIIQTKKE